MRDRNQREEGMNQINKQQQKQQQNGADWRSGAERGSRRRATRLCDVTSCLTATYAVCIVRCADVVYLLTLEVRCG